MNPGMKEAYYFSHDSNAQHDPKMIKLIFNLGWEGYGLYWGIIERLRNEKDYCMPTDYECIAMAMRTECDRIKSIIEDYNLFVIEEDYFYSKSLLERMKLREIKSNKARESAYKRWNKDANAMRVQCDSNAIKESKGKEIKGNERKGNKKPLDSKESDKKMTLLEYFGIAFKKCFNETYHANFGKDGTMLKDLEKHYGYDKVIANINYFFENYIATDDFAMENPNVGTFQMKWNSLSSKRSGKKSLTRGEKKIVDNAEKIMGVALD